MIRNIAIAAALLGSMSACASSGQSEKIMLTRNMASIQSPQDMPRCKQVRVYNAADGSLWIGDPTKHAALKPITYH